MPHASGLKKHDLIFCYFNTTKKYLTPMEKWQHAEIARHLLYPISSLPSQNIHSFNRPWLDGKSGERDWESITHQILFLSCLQHSKTLRILF